MPCQMQQPSPGRRPLPLRLSRQRDELPGRPHNGFRSNRGVSCIRDLGADPVGNSQMNDVLSAGQHSFQRIVLMAKPLPLRIWDRRSRKIVKEFMDDSKSTYEARPRRSPTQWLESEPLYDWLVSAWNNSRFSVRKIEPFIKKHHIDMSEFEPVIYRSYAEFFTRRFKPGKRSFPRTLGEMGAFAEARYFGWSNVTSGQRFPIKGKSLDPDAILGQKSKTYAQFFEGGPVIMARLAPVDYHHLHYPDSGATVDHYHEGRPIWTINWRALQSKDDILIKNERCIHFCRRTTSAVWASWKSEQ